MGPASLVEEARSAVSKPTALVGGRAYPPTMATTYMLRCADGSYYVGSTRDLRRRLEQHASGLGATYTSRRLPVELVWAADFEHIGEAFAWEKRVQGWSRAKREALVRGELDVLPALSARRRRSTGVEARVGSPGFEESPLAP